MKDKITSAYALYNGDCVEVMEHMPSNSVDLSVFSPPFANLYIYSDDIRDMGNCKNEEEFFVQMGYMTEQLYRIMRPGRIVCVHCKQIARYKGRDGAAGWYDFRGDIIRHFESYGFQYHSEVVIWTDPVMEMQKTKTQRLLYCNLRRDASVTGIGMPEYLCIFRKTPKDGDKTEPIRHYKPDEKRPQTKSADLQVMDLPTWQRYASPVWFDISRTDVLNVKVAKDNRDEKHICPLQLGVIRRAVQLWSNPNELVFSPFAGIGSEGYVSIQEGRKFVGIELKEQYFNVACKNLDEAVAESQALTLFDAMEVC